MDIVPVEADPGGAVLDTLSAGEWVEPPGEPLEGLTLSLVRLPGFPIGRLRSVTINVGVASPHFLFQLANNLFRAEGAALLGEHDLKGHIQQQVAQLTAHRVVITVPDGVHELEGLFEQIGSQRLVRLRGVPGAAGSQDPNDGQRPVEGLAALLPAVPNLVALVHFFSRRTPDRFV